MLAEKLKPEHEEPKLYEPVAAILFTIGIYFLSQVVAGLLLSLIPFIQGWDEAKTNDWLKNSIWATTLYLAFVTATTVWTISLLLKSRGATFKNIGLNRPQLKYIAYAFNGFVVYFVLYLIGRALIGLLIPAIDVVQDQDIGFQSGTQGASLILVFASLAIFPPLAEEIVMRGFLYGGLRTRLTFPVATIITSLIFGAAHLGGGKESLLWLVAVDTFILSLVMCYLREKTNSLWPPIFLHMIKNTLAFSVLFIFLH
ncbi:MAG: type II CAAX endopeptidase family protein [Patescibacteria group bacterium]